MRKVALLLALALLTGCVRRPVQQNPPAPVPTTVPVHEPPQISTETQATADVGIQKYYVTVSPATVAVRAGQQVQFSAVVHGVKNQAVTWSAARGQITPTGLYTAVGQADVITAKAVQIRRSASASTNVIGGPLTYTVARTDTDTTQLPNPMPTWGGAKGAGTTWCNPAFNNICITRLTDRTTTPNGASLTTADGGEAALVSTDSHHIISHTPGGYEVVMAFDPATKIVSNTPLAFKGFDTVLFSHYDPQVMIAQKNHTEVHKLTAAADWSSYTDTLMFDFVGTCLPAGFQSTWDGSFYITLDDVGIRMAFSNAGGQGSGTYVAAYNTNDNSCSLLRTDLGQVFVNGTLIGSIDDGVNPLADRFTVHEGGGGLNPKFALVGYSLHQPGGASGCLAGNCDSNSPYVWEIGTTHLRPCGPYQCSGHNSKQYTRWATGKFLKLHNYPDPSQPLTKLIITPPTFPDMHGSGQNGNFLDTTPIFMFSTDVTPIIPYPSWGYDEIIGVMSDGSQKFWRFGQTLNTGLSKYFICANAIGVVSQMGDGLVFTSDMGSGGVLGFEKDGVTPACDTFWMDAK